MTAQGMATGPADSLVQYCTPIPVLFYITTGSRKLKEEETKDS